MLRIRKYFAAAATLALAACADSVPTAPAPIAGPTAARSVAPVWATNFTGVTGEGSDYAIFVPASWNGDVVYYAHGIRDVAEPVGLPTSSVAGLRDALGVMGYAVAYSSFSENGWAVKDGIQRTHQLRGLFASKAGKARRSYVIGHSMGGLISLALAEQFPQQYDGALPMCGVLGGAQKQIDYIANVRTVFDYFYPGALPGNALDMPIGLNPVTQVQAPAQAAIFGNFGKAVALSRVDQTPVPWTTIPQLVESIITALTFDARGADDLLDRTHGHSPFDNMGASYYTSASLSPALMGDLNNRTLRFEETPDAANYLNRYYEPSGALQIPVVSLHTTLDPVVPFFHEDIYGERAAASQLLLRRSVNRYGHCRFTIGEMTDAFRALTGWVETGVRPTQ